jgi:hypothetical protein
MPMLGDTRLGSMTGKAPFALLFVALHKKQLRVTGSYFRRYAHKGSYLND